jgi:hypothetical protein
MKPTRATPTIETPVERTVSLPWMLGRLPGRTMGLFFQTGLVRQGIVNDNVANSFSRMITAARRLHGHFIAGNFVESFEAAT